MEGSEGKESEACRGEFPMGSLTAAVILNVHFTGLRKFGPKVAKPGEMDESEYATNKESCSGSLSF